MTQLVEKVESLVLRSTDLARDRDFYTRCWGLSPAFEADGAIYLRGSGTAPYVLGLEAAPSPGLARIEMRARDEAAVDALHARVLSAGCPVTGAPGPISGGAGGHGFDFRDSDGRPIRILVRGRATAGEARTGFPIGISHVVLNSPDPDAATRFHAEILGFRVNDWSESQMSFLSCSTAHHELAFNRENSVTLNHVAFEMASFGSVMTGLGRMRQAGHDTRWGVGSHGIADIMFAYFIDPNGYVIEYAHCERAFGPDHRAKVWPRSPYNMDAWGTAGFPGAEIRAAMAGASQRGAAS